MTRREFVHAFDSYSKTQLYITLVAAAIFVISGGVLIASLFSQRGPGPHFGGSLTEGVAGQPQFINPVLSAVSPADSDLSRLVFAQLLKYNGEQALVPDLAETMPEISADQKSYTIKLKQNLRWQDGKPLTADDIIFTVQTIQAADTESALRPNWIRVKVQKIDDLTVKFSLNEVSNSFINNFALGIIPKHIWSDLSGRNFRLSDFNLKAVGSGPFVVSEIKKTADGTIKSVALKANELYYEGRPYLNELTLKFYPDYDTLINAYQGREFQSMGLVPFDKNAFSLEQNKNESYDLSLPQYQAVFFNLARNAVLAEKAVRQALWLATDRNQIINDVYSGNVSAAYGPIFPENLGYNPAIEKSVHFSLTEANAILDKAGWTMDSTTGIRVKNKKTLEFNLVVSGNLVLNVKTAQVIEAQWKKIGAKANLIIVGPKELQDEYIRGRSFDAILTSENTGADPDPFPFWHSSQSHDPGLNLSEFNNAEADKMLTSARQTQDPSTRIANYQRFQEIINGELPAIFLTRSLYIYNVPKNLDGINFTHIITPSERFADVKNWYFAK
jgi:peptide/nickel transport system substrate-binding protein